MNKYVGAKLAALLASGIIALNTNPCYGKVITGYKNPNV